MLLPPPLLQTWHPLCSSLSATMRTPPLDVAQLFQTATGHTQARANRSCPAVASGDDLAGFRAIRRAAFTMLLGRHHVFRLRERIHHFGETMRGISAAPIHHHSCAGGLLTRMRCNVCCSVGDCHPCSARTSRASAFPLVSGSLRIVRPR